MADVSMDYDVVQGISDGFGTAGDTLKAVSTALEAAINILRATAFVGLVGGLALERYLSGIKPNVDKLAATCEEMQLDLIGAITSLRDGDNSGSQRFVA